MIPKCSFDSTFYPQAQSGAFNQTLRPGDFSAFSPTFIQYKETEDREQINTGIISCFIYGGGSSYQSLPPEGCFLRRILAFIFLERHTVEFIEEKLQKCIETLHICVQPAKSSHSLTSPHSASMNSSAKLLPVPSNCFPDK